MQRWKEDDGFYGLPLWVMTRGRILTFDAFGLGWQGGHVQFTHPLLL